MASLLKGCLPILLCTKYLNGLVFWFLPFFDFQQATNSSSANTCFLIFLTWKLKSPSYLIHNFLSKGPMPKVSMRNSWKSSQLIFLGLKLSGLNGNASKVWLEKWIFMTIPFGGIGVTAQIDMKLLVRDGTDTQDKRHQVQVIGQTHLLAFAFFTFVFEVILHDHIITFHLLLLLLNV